MNDSDDQSIVSDDDEPRFFNSRAEAMKIARKDKRNKHSFASSSSKTIARKAATVLLGDDLRRATKKAYLGEHGCIQTISHFVRKSS